MCDSSCRTPHLAASSSYQRGCRCVRCMEWYRTRRGARSPSEVCAFPDRKVVTSYQYGCRCPRCKSGWAEYIRNLRKRPPLPPSLQCAVCNASFRPSKINSKCCSKKCQGHYQWLESGKWIATWLRQASGCDDCGEPYFRPGVSSGLCEDCAQARRQEHFRRKNRRRRGLTPGGYTLTEIGDRDGWRCHLCQKKVNRSLSGMDDDGPTIDHLNPVSAGGDDSRQNVALAHRSCNVKRSNTGPAQLRLIG